MKKLILILAFVISSQILSAQWEKCNYGLNYAPLNTAVITDNFLIVNQNIKYFTPIWNYICFNDSLNWEAYNPLNKEGVFVRDNNSSKILFFSDSIYVSNDNLLSWKALCEFKIDIHTCKFCVQDSIFTVINKGYDCYISHDFGKNWCKNNFFPGIGGGNVEIFISGTNILVSTYMSPRITSDFGLTWNYIAFGEGKFRSDNNNTYFGANSTFWKSNDSGKTWKNLSNNFTFDRERYYYYKEFTVKNDTIYLLCDDKLFILTDEGKKLVNSFTIKNENYYYLYEINNIYLFKNNLFILSDQGVTRFNLNTNEFIISSNNLCKPKSSQIFVNDEIIINNFIGITENINANISFNNADSWSVKTFNLSNSRDLYEYLFKSKDSIYIKSFSGVLVFNKNGEFFRKVNLKNIKAGIFYDNIYFISKNKGIYKSYSFDSIWTKSGLDSLDIERIIVHNNKIFASSKSELYVSEDKGENWILVDNLPEKKPIFHLQTDQKVLFVNQYYSTSNGLTWDSINYKFDIQDYDVKNNIIIANDKMQNVFLSTNFGKKWTQLDLSSLNLSSLTYSLGRLYGINDKYIYISTQYEGIYRSKISDLLATDVSESNLSKFVISPNPAGDYIEIKIVISNEVRNPGIEIFNIFGEKISTPSLLRNATPQEGNIKIDISNVAPGVYFIKIGDKFEKFVKI